MASSYPRKADVGARLIQIPHKPELGTLVLAHPKLQQFAAGR